MQRYNLHIIKSLVIYTEIDIFKLYFNTKYIY